MRRLSHDLRGSLANLRMGLQACRESPEMLAMLGDALLQEVDRLDARLIQLNWMARCGAPERDEVNLHLVVDSWATEKGVANLRLEPVQASLDPDLVKAALDQLYDNAVKHGGGYIGTTLRVSEGRIRLEIADRGSAWPDNISEFLQDPQLWNGQLALGLALAQRVARAHQGELELGEGKVALILPL